LWLQAALLVKSQHILEHEGSLSCSQGPGIGPYPEPDEASPHPPILYLYNIITVVIFAIIVGVYKPG
jgi:hypothetical protein